MSDTTICDDCIFANWKRTTNGRLHPDKSGRCKAPLPNFDVPAAFYWGALNSGPRPNGGYIERGSQLHRACSFKQTEPKP